jgi:hypothetical protein
MNCYYLCSVVTGGFPSAGNPVCVTRVHTLKGQEIKKPGSLTGPARFQGSGFCGSGTDLR